MKRFILMLAAAAVFAMSNAAYADQTTTTTTTTTTITTQTSTYFVNHDPAVIAALAALNSAMAHYDVLIESICNHNQRVEYAAMQKHEDWFFLNPLTYEERNAYLAYLCQRLHFDGQQCSEAARIEGHFLREVGPLYTAYQNALIAAYQAWRATQVTTIQTQTIATPPAMETVPYTPAPQQVQVKEETTKVKTKFIRNVDRK